MDLKYCLVLELTTCQVIKETFSHCSDFELKKVAFETLNKKMEEIDYALLCLQRSRE